MTAPLASRARFEPVAVLFARADSVYKALPGCDVWDIERDARKWPGGCPVVAHPPCRAWGRLRHLAKPRDDEKELAVWAVDQVRRWGGVLEHPAASTLWAACNLPEPGRFDAVGGFTIGIHQNWFGHRATKATLLYTVGLTPSDLPTMPMRLGGGSHVIAQKLLLKDGTRMPKGDPRKRPECTKPEREHTPPELARWLIELARRTRVEQREAA